MRRPFLQIVAVLLGAAAALRAGDALPGILTGVPRGVVVCTALSEATALTGLRLQLPPALSVYQPIFRGIRATRAPQAALAVTMHDPTGNTLAVFRSAFSSIDRRLFQPLFPFHEIAIQVAGRPAMLRASNQPGGPAVQDLEWIANGTRTVLRFDGPTLELLRIADQMARLEP
jgi:hypothetical protein